MFGRLDVLAMCKSLHSIIFDGYSMVFIDRHYPLHKIKSNFSVFVLNFNLIISNYIHLFQLYGNHFSQTYKYKQMAII